MRQIMDDVTGIFDQVAPVGNIDVEWFAVGDHQQQLAMGLLAFQVF